MLRVFPIRLRSFPSPIACDGLRLLSVNPRCREIRTAYRSILSVSIAASHRPPGPRRMAFAGYALWPFHAASA